MVERNISDENLKEELIKVIDMEEKIDSLQELINEEKLEDKIALKKANTLLRNYEIQSKEDKNLIKEQGYKLKEKDSELKEKDSELKEKDNMIKKIITNYSNIQWNAC